MFAGCLRLISLFIFWQRWMDGRDAWPDQSLSRRSSLSTPFYVLLLLCRNVHHTLGKRQAWRLLEAWQRGRDAWVTESLGWRNITLMSLMLSLHAFTSWRGAMRGGWMKGLGRDFTPWPFFLNAKESKTFSGGEVVVCLICTMVLHARSFPR